MNSEINYKNNPLNGVGLKKMLVEITDYYGFEILFAYLNINCFKINPSIASSVKFLKKTEWAREKVEAFYLYKFKNLPGVSSEQFTLSPRDRIIPDDQKPGEPAKLSLEDAERLREKREKKAAEWSPGSGGRIDSGKRFVQREYHFKDRGNKHASAYSPSADTDSKIDPWAKAKSKLGG
ncbi:MAG: VF530 family DNA-binding protein [Gammaproteobacteria bacterium]